MSFTGEKSPIPKNIYHTSSTSKHPQTKTIYSSPPPEKTQVQHYENNIIVFQKSVVTYPPWKEIPIGKHHFLGLYWFQGGYHSCLNYTSPTNSLERWFVSFSEWQSHCLSAPNIAWKSPPEATVEIAPENKPSQKKESHLPSIIFQGRTVKLRGCNLPSATKHVILSLICKFETCPKNMLMW